MICTFVYSDRSGLEYLLHFRESHPVVSKFTLQATPSYVISDTIPKLERAVKVLNMHISSVHDEKGNAFHNKILAAGELGGLYPFPTFSFLEYFLCGYGKDEPELQFLYDSFGGSLRLLRGCYKPIIIENEAC